VKLGSCRGDADGLVKKLRRARLILPEALNHGVTGEKFVKQLIHQNMSLQAKLNARDKARFQKFNFRLTLGGESLPSGKPLHTPGPPIDSSKGIEELLAFHIPKSDHSIIVAGG
jgi:hypothetical protein